jgi:hypothetical protein
MSAPDLSLQLYKETLHESSFGKAIDSEHCLTYLFVNVSLLDRETKPPTELPLCWSVIVSHLLYAAYKQPQEVILLGI